MNIQRASSYRSSFFSSGWKYDVFLSFRGEDIRKNFTDHLSAALIQEGINVLSDDEEHERENPISKKHLQAIEESRFSIVVFSRSYASSIWCLEELVKMVECWNIKGQTIIPIFYDVDPSEVREQTGAFEEAFVGHEETFREDIEKVKSWRNALKEVTNLFGWNLQERHHSEVIQDIFKNISNKLNVTMNVENLVGIDSHLEELKNLILERRDDVRMVGIFGMGGIGKTTIARVVFEMMSSDFEASSFVANVRESSKTYGLVSLQKLLLSQTVTGIDFDIHNVYDGIDMIKNSLGHKKVLIVLDDVFDINELAMLAGKHDWFGSGSRIIVTTRDRSLLTAHRVDEVYEVKGLNDNEALQLFNSKALIRNHSAPADYLKLSKAIVEYAGGVPLALEVMGSYLHARTIHQWKDEIKRLQEDPLWQVSDILRISFDGLMTTEKAIFLNVACFFEGKDRHYVTNILESNGLNPNIGLPVLIDKGLVTISENNKLSMHRLLKEMGQQMFMKEYPQEFEKYRRFWEEAEILDAFTENLGSQLFSVSFLVLEAISVALDLYGKNKRGFLLAAFLLSAFGLILTMYVSIKKRNAADLRFRAERQLGWVEVIFSVVQFITTLVHYILAVARVKDNYNVSVLPLAFAIVGVVFAFKKEKMVITHAEVSTIQLKNMEGNDANLPLLQGDDANFRLPSV